jgi:hypothetical protein
MPLKEKGGKKAGKTTDIEISSDHREKCHEFSVH